ncbi:MAG: RuBisCO large subunit C-terminal-like domain-containing protein, partial [Candidatus Aenigmarchaeota archaeon]|nr:RuBisCO large subunit C-terminal-like domain-containing protein [Candidatus Aenigmarchaeota archaeon]
LSSIAGNVFGMKAVKNLRLEDISWPHKIIKSFRGPLLGIRGIRKILKVWKRPLTATVPKPKVGLSTAEYCETAYKIWKSGIDFVKNDENLTSQNFIKFYRTTEKILKIKDKAERETGEKKLYLPNVSAETEEMIKRARFVSEHSGEIVMVDVLTVGWAGVQSLREACEDLNLGIYSHRAFHASFTRNPKHGMSMLCVTDIARLIGMDAIHIGGMGKLVSPKHEIFILKKNLVENAIGEKNSLLAKNWNRIKPVFPVSSGGLHPGIIPRLIKLLGKDIIIQVGGGVMGHKMGIDGGGKAVRQAIDAALQNIPLKEYAKKHKELEVALKMWGHATPV